MSSIKERLIQVVLRGKDLLSPEANKGKEALASLREEGEKLRAELDKAQADNALVKSLSALNKESERAERDLTRASTNVEKLREELNQSPGSKGLEVSLKNAEREALRAQKALDKVSAATKETAQQAKAAGIDTSKLSDEEKRLAAELEKAKAAVSDNSKATKDLQKEQAAAARSAAEQESRTQSLRSALSGAEKRVLAFAAAYISLNAALGLARKGFDLLAGGISSVVSLGDAAAQTSQRLAGLMGGDEAGAQAGKWIEEFADKSGRRINDVTEAFVGLKAYGLDPMDGSLEALINKTTQLGGDASTLQGISLALGQMWAKEKIAQEEVNQLRERGVNAFDLLAKAMGKTTVQIQDMAAKGQLGRNEIKLLIDEIGRSADGAAAGALDTLSGKWNVLQNQFQKFGERIASSGVMELLNEKLQGVLDTVGELTEDGTLDNLAVAFADAFGQGAERVEEFVKSLADVDFKHLIDQSAAWLSDFGSKIDSAVEAGQTASRVLTGVWHGFRAMITGAATVLVGIINMTLGNLLRAAAAITDALGLEAATEKMRHATGLMQEMQDAFAQASIESGEKVTAAISGQTDQRVAEHKREQASYAELAAEKRRLAEEEAAFQEELANKVSELNERFAEQSRTAALEGTRALEDLDDALNVIDTTNAQEELERFRRILRQAGADSGLMGDDLGKALNAVDKKLAEMAQSAQAAAKDLTTLEGVMKAIDSAVNSIDTRTARSALEKLYKDGKISAEEFETAQAKLNARIAELNPAASGAANSLKSYTSAAKSAAKAANELEKSNSKAADSAKKSTSNLSDFISQTTNAARGPLADMSAAALAAFDKLKGISSRPKADSSDLDGISASLKGVNEQLGAIQRTSAQGSLMTGFGRWQLDMLKSSNRLQKSYLQEKAALLSLQESYESGGMSASAYAASASAALANSKLLSKEDLSGLRSGIAAAKQQMDQLAASTKGTLQGLKDELLQLQGTQEEVEKSQMAARRRELQAQLATATKDGDSRAISNLQEALRTLTQIEEERIRQLRNEKAEAAKQQQQAQAKETTSAPRAAQKVIRLEAPGGRAVNVAVDSQQDEAALLGLLEQYAMRTH